MLLLSAIEAAQAIGAKCGGSCPDVDDPALVDLLSLLTSRVETALGVNSLTRGNFKDRFILENSSHGSILETVLRLNNGFVDTSMDPLIVTDPQGYTLQLDLDGQLVVGAPEGLTTSLYSDATLDIDKEQGLVGLSTWSRGIYHVTYTAGFDACESKALPNGSRESSRVLSDVPDWLKSIAIAYLVKWYRTIQLVPKHSKDVSFEAVMHALDRELGSLVYGRYLRPRMGVIWGMAR